MFCRAFLYLLKFLLEVTYLDPVLLSAVFANFPLQELLDRLLPVNHRLDLLDL